MNITVHLALSMRTRTELEDTKLTYLCWAAIAAEKKEEEFKHSIEGFNRKSLKKAETEVKNPLPTKEGNNACYSLKNNAITPSSSKHTYLIIRSRVFLSWWT